MKIPVRTEHVPNKRGAKKEREQERDARDFTGFKERKKSDFNFFPCKQLEADINKLFVYPKPCFRWDGKFLAVGNIRFLIHGGTLGITQLVSCIHWMQIKHTHFISLYSVFSLRNQPQAHLVVLSYAKSDGRPSMREKFFVRDGTCLM